jgi:uncharacterized protein YciI
MSGMTVRAFMAAWLLLLTSACAVLETQAKGKSPAMHELFLFQYAPGPAWRAGVAVDEQGLGPHAAYMAQLLKQGRLFAGGGYTNAEGGMAIVTASDMGEARSILAADPAVVDGIFIAELRHWAPRFRVEAPLPISD